MKYMMSTYGNQKILLSDDQYFRVVQAWDAGAEEFSINDQRIPRKAISYLGFTEGALSEMKNEENAYFRSLPDKDRRELQEAQYKKAREEVEKNRGKSIESGKMRVWKGLGGKSLTVEINQQESLPATYMSEEESERGDADYWVDDDGIKHYD